MAREGFYSLFDGTGLPVGQDQQPPINHPTAGFFSLFDFTGLPVGFGVGGAVPVHRGHGPKVGGKLYLHSYMRMLAERRGLHRKVIQTQKTLSRTILGWKGYQLEQEQKMMENKKKCAEKQMYSVLLAMI